jgi:2-iminoacetate synthase ThiH
VLKEAGDLGIPITTGIIIGIRETAFEKIDSIYSIKEIHKKYANCYS